MTLRKGKRIKKSPSSFAPHSCGWFTVVGVRLPLDGSEEAEDSRSAGKGREFIRRRLQSKEVIIFSRSVAKSLIKVAAERNQQGPHQFYVLSFFLRESLPCSFIVKRSDSGDSLSNLITATFNWICDRRKSTFGSHRPVLIGDRPCQLVTRPGLALWISFGHPWCVHIAWEIWKQKSFHSFIFNYHWFLIYRLGHPANTAL